MNVIAESFRDAVIAVIKRELGGYNGSAEAQVDHLVDLIAEEVKKQIENIRKDQG